MTLATIPSRIASIGPVIDSIKNQTRRPDRIYVCICQFCEWEESSYEIPGWLAADDALEIVVSPTDYGPANKLLGMLHREPDPATCIVIVDDDWAYRPDMLEVLGKRFGQGRRAAIGSSGARIPRAWSVMETRIGGEISAKPRMPHQLVFMAESPVDIAVDILQFGFGSIVLRGWFDHDIYGLIQPREPLFFSDDVLFSAYLESKGIKRVCISGLPLPRLLDHADLRPLHGEGRSTRNYQAAIPAISSRLNIWPPESLIDPRPSVLDVLRYWGRRSMRKACRVAIESLVWWRKRPAKSSTK